MLSNVVLRSAVQLHKGVGFNATRQFASKAGNADKGTHHTHSNSVASSQDVDSASTRLQARQLLDRLEASRSRGSTAGPFGAATVSDDMDAPPEKTFSEQRTFGGKVGRATQQTSRFTIILIGASVTGLLAYTMGTELFSPNSPTRIYNKACKLIGESEEVRKWMGDSKLSFSQGHDSRRRNHQIQHMTAYDAYGKEHMIMRFFVYSHLANEDTQSWSEWVESLTVTDVARKVKREVQTLINPDLRYDDGMSEKKQQEQQPRSSWFGALGSGINRLGHRQKVDKKQLYDQGQVYGDLVMENGYFEWNLLYVDMPTSSAFGRKRIYIKPA